MEHIANQPLLPSQEARAKRFAAFLDVVQTIDDLLGGEGGDCAGDFEPREPVPPDVPPMAAALRSEYFAPVVPLHPQPAVYHAGRQALRLVHST